MRTDLHETVRRREEGLMGDDDALRFLSGLVNYEHQSPAARHLTLAAIRALLSALGNPHDRLFIVHVAGTKGKGSVASMLERVLRQAGYRTGLYTSPELSSFEERIRVDGDPIPSAALVELLSQIRNAVSAAQGPANLLREVTFFDVTTALAFLYFEVKQVDVAIIEVGMGGRSDSTNVCMPRLSVITSISYDHTRQLGNTLTLIAREKAGIIKPGRPTVSGVTTEEARHVIEQTCEERGSRLVQLGVDFSYSYTPGEASNRSLTPSRVFVTTKQRPWPAITLNLLGEHQAANTAIVVTAIEQLRDLGLEISDQAVLGGYIDLPLPARIEIVRRGPLVVLDSAHNVASAQALAMTLQQSFPEHFGDRKKSGARRSLVFAASRDKDLAGMMAFLAPHFDHAYLTQYTRSKRSASEGALLAALQASKVDLPATYVSDPMEAWKRAEAGASADDLICITGSTFLAGELRPLFRGAVLSVTFSQDPTEDH